MSFVWPQMLFTLAVLPLIAGFYLWRQRSQRAASQTLSGISAATASGQAWRPHLPPLLFLLGLALMLFALSRPATVVSMPTSHRTVILALDIVCIIMHICADFIHPRPSSCPLRPNSMPRPSAATR